MKNIQNKKQVANIIEQSLITELERLKTLKENVEMSIDMTEKELEKIKQKKLELYS